MSTTHIVVAQSGWVFVGDIREEGDRLHVTRAACVRRWGTTRGLGEIALGGPTSSTTLDPCGEVIIRLPAVLFTIPCTAERWEAVPELAG